MDDIKAIISLATNTSVTLLVISFYLYKDMKFSQQLQSTLTTLVDTVETLKDITIARGKSGADDSK